MEDFVLAAPRVGGEGMEQALLKALRVSGGGKELEAERSSPSNSQSGRGFKMF